MTVRRYSSTSQETNLTSALSSGATTMVVNSASALLSSITPGVGETFTVVIDPDTALEEIVDVISPSAPGSNTLTITRGVGVDGTTAISHSAGAKVRHMAIGRDFREANNHIENTTTAHGLTLANVTLSTGTGNVSTQMLASNAVTTAKITDLNVTTGKLADGAVTSAKIADLTIATGDIADSAITSGKIATGAVGTTKIDDLSVTEGKLAPNAVTSAKIADGTIVAGDLADGAVTSAKILDGTIVNADINTAAAIDKTKIAGTAVTIADTGTVTSTMIADGTITNTDINSAAGIAYSKLSLTGSITSSDIVDGTIVNGDISPTAAIALSKLATDPLARANHTGTQTASTISDFDTQVRTSRLDQMAAPTAAVSANSQKVTNLGTPTVSTDASTKGYVDTQITNLIGAAPSTLDTLAEISAAINSDPNLYATLNNGKLNRDGTQAMTGALPMGTFKITGMGDPTNAQDAATKNYVDTGASSQVAAAAASATAAASSATAAAGSATSASGSATSATSSATSATASASSATSSASAAATSATNAANSATSASNSATTASTQATNAANSASAASTSATNAASSATSASSSAADAATTYDNFDDRYLGAKSTPPTLDNDGNALIVGALYWNSVSNAMFAWSGTAWGSISSTAAIFRYRFTATAGQTSISGLDDNGLTLSYLAGKEQVYLNGVLLVRTSDYTATNGTSITSLAALALNDIVEIITFTAFDLATAIPNTVMDAKGDLIVGTAADTVGKITVGTNGQYLQADSSTATGLTWSTVSGYSAPTLGSTSIASGATVSNVNGLTINSTTIPSSVTLVSTVATQTLTNKTLTSPTLTTPIVVSPEERTTVSATAATGTINFDAVTQGVLYYTSNASANWTLNVRGDSGTTLNSILATGDSITVAFLVTNGGTAYRHSALTIDGSAVTPKWSGGTAPAAGNASSIDAYSFTIVKTASATYTVFGAGPIKYA